MKVNDFNLTAIQKNLMRLINQIYKLLPQREEEKDWKTPLSTIIEELLGMIDLLNQEKLFSLLCKLQGLNHLEQEEDFPLYRRIIFECLTLLNEIKDITNPLINSFDEKGLSIEEDNEVYNAIISIKLNLIQSTNFNKPFASADLMSWLIISKSNTI